jgi:hypothetical protein
LRRGLWIGVCTILPVKCHSHRRAVLGEHTPDILARIIASALSDAEGWKVVVENKPGAVMTIGTAEVLHQPADGIPLVRDCSHAAVPRSF